MARKSAHQSTAEQSTAEQSTAEQLEQEWNKLLWGVQRSIRYHTARRRFFDNFHNTTTALSVILGSATIYSVLGTFEMLAIVAASLVTVLSTIDLVIGTTAKARLHHDLGKRFAEVERLMVCAAAPARDLYEQCISDRLTIETEEPPKLAVLDSIMHNDLLRAQGGDPEYFVDIGFWQRQCAQFFDVGGDRLRMRKLLQQERTAAS